MLKTQKMCNKAFNKSFFEFFYIPDQYKTQEMFDRIIFNEPFSIRYVPDQYKTKQTCDKAVDDCLTALKWDGFPDWFVASIMIKKLFSALYADENILYFDEDSGNVVFICNRMVIFIIDLNNINLDDTNYNEDGPDTFIHGTLLAWHVKFEKCKELKKELNEELMPIAWHPKRWWDWCVSKDENKERDLPFIEEL